MELLYDNHVEAVKHFKEANSQIPPKYFENVVYKEEFPIKGYIFYHSSLVGIYIDDYILIEKKDGALPSNLEREVLKGKKRLKGVFVIVHDGYYNYKIKIYLTENGSKRKWLFHESEWFTEREFLR